MQKINVFFPSFFSEEEERLFRVYRAVYAQETATLLERAQLSANRLYFCGITDNPGRFDNKSTQVTQVLRRTEEGTGLG